MPRTFKVEVFYEDTDFSGIVYHANYFKFIERARSEFVESLGISQLDLKKENMIFVVHRISAEFRRPTHYKDLLTVETNITKIGGASISLRQKIMKQNDCVFSAEVKLAFLVAEKAVRLPRGLKEKLLISS